MKKQVLEILQKKHDIYINCFRETQNDEFLHKSRALWEVIEQVMQLPDDDWIEVCERMPEKSGYYLHCASGRGRGLQEGVGVSYYMHKVKEWKKTYTPAVIAWKPFPEPFRKE